MLSDFGRFLRRLHCDPAEYARLKDWQADPPADPLEARQLQILVRRLQRLTPPEGRNEPDYAAKIHLGTAPVYYQNYLLGALAASQLRQAPPAAGEGGNCLVGNLRAGEFLRRSVFAVGVRYSCKEMLRQAAGRKLSAEPFLAEFAG